MGKLSIWAPEKLSAISINGLGRIAPNRQNVRSSHCTQCAGAIQPALGYAFRAEHGARLHSGYLCQTCIGAILREVHGWFFNKHFEILQPVINDTPRAIDGDCLADIWIEGGVKSLFARVANTDLSE